jgi:hypothetical protein
MADDDEIAWHKEQIAKNGAVLAELEASNTSGEMCSQRPNQKLTVSKLRLLNPT